jgi:hypothetical protein
MVGLDLGQTTDYSALAVLEAQDAPKEPTRYSVRHLHRWPLGTAYTQIVNDVKTLVARPPLSSPVLALDEAGVGRAVADLFAEAKLAARMQRVTITAGRAVSPQADGSWHVAKVQLVSILQTLL